MNLLKPLQTFFLLLLLAGNTAVSQTDYAARVNPFTGTKKMGHTFPGACVPFGLVQLSPDTRMVPYARPDGSYNKETYAYCAGYQYQDSSIIGFSHTHFSGTGHSDLGDFLLMPYTGPNPLNPGPGKEEPALRSSFRKETESASPGYYQVHLDDFAVKSELTATTRTGFHRYTFEKGGECGILLDLVYNIYNFPDKNVWAEIRVENDTLITGWRQTQGWARNKTLYFAMVFSKPVLQYGHRKYDQSVYRGFWRKFDESRNFPEMAGKDLRAWFGFNTTAGEQITVRFALSVVSTENALENLRTECPVNDFDQIARKARNAWNAELGKIEAEFLNPDDSKTFYTALYHCFISPVTFMDADRQYRGLDHNTHTAEGFTHYSIFSLWDTYRALHPLFNLIQPARNADMIRSMMAHQNQSVHKMLPIWSHYASENWCMTGYHAVSVLADAAVKKIPGFDRREALADGVQTAGVEYFDGLGEYLRRGYVPEDKSPNSVSKTLEYAYDDWCIARLAEVCNDSLTEKIFSKRAENWKNVFDPRSGFMRPRLSDGSFKQEFDVLSTHGQGFIEGNAWNYSLFVPHNPLEMIRLKGGSRRFAQHLDSLFTMQISDDHIRETEDITRDGIIGNYVHGNEPGHHIPYLYSYAGFPEKTQEKVRLILRSMYGPGPDGLCGNDDAGQMSAWYVFSALGFYPVCPGSPEYTIGSPLITSAVLHFENGKQLRIECPGQSEKNKYIRKIMFNGKRVTAISLSHHDLMQGGLLQFYMKP